MTNTVVRDDAASYQRDAAIYRVISRCGVKPVVFDIAPEQEAALADEINRIFGLPVLDDAETEQREHEAEQHAPLFRAIKQSRQQ
jgi:hypothetical protein